jgi:hypothetical protein
VLTATCDSSSSAADSRSALQPIARRDLPGLIRETR